MTKIDLDSLEAIVKGYLAGSHPSSGWKLLDTLERYLFVSLTEPGIIDVQRAEALLVQIRTKFSAEEELSRIQDRLRDVVREYEAGLRAFAESGKVTPGLWNAVVLKGEEKRYYEFRLRQAQSRTL